MEFSLCLLFAKLVSYTFLYWLPLYIFNVGEARTSTLGVGARVPGPLPLPGTQGQGRSGLPPPHSPSGQGKGHLHTAGPELGRTDPPSPQEEASLVRSLQGPKDRPLPGPYWGSIPWGLAGTSG